jgi:L-serine dehydratase
VGGGFVVDEAAAQVDDRAEADMPYPSNTAVELVALATDNGCSIAALMASNEAALARRPDLHAGILRIWAAMRECVDAGLTPQGTLPGALHVRRRARLPAAEL